jgi:hypothetical protein
MKKTFLFTTTIVISCFTIVLWSSCTKNGNANLDPVDDKCGEPYEWQSQNEFFVNSGMDNSGQYRTFYLEDLNAPDDICTEEHIPVTYTLGCRGGTTPPADMTVTAKAYWGAGQPQTAPMVYDAAKHQFSASMSVGLKQAYPDQPGSVYTQIMVKLKSVGGQSLDSIRADSFVHSPTMIVKYKIYKPK